MYYSHYDSPLGQLLLVGDGQSIHRIDFPESCRPVTIQPHWKASEAVFSQVTDELSAYFDGSLRNFTVAITPNGTAFQRKVWDALLTIDYGQTCTYSQIAKLIGQPTASRAVGSANGRNPVSILIPCHRVIGTNGALTGYAGGVSSKQWLLSHEAGEQALFPFEEW